MMTQQWWQKDRYSRDCTVSSTSSEADAMNNDIISSCDPMNGSDLRCLSECGDSKDGESDTSMVTPYERDGYDAELNIRGSSIGQPLEDVSLVSAE